MNIVRVMSLWMDGGVVQEQYKIVLLCGIDEQQRILDGEWMGYVKNDGISHPFILKSQNKLFFYGGDEHDFQSTNIGEKFIRVGHYFSLFEDSESTYKITNVHPYVR